MSVQHYAAIMAYRTKRPVKFKLTRQESINWHPKRHPMSIDMTTACDENGILTAMKATLITDAGAYASLSGPVLQRACTHAAGPYNYQVIDITSIGIVKQMLKENKLILTDKLKINPKYIYISNTILVNFIDLKI